MGNIGTKNSKKDKIIRKKIVVVGLENVGKTTLVQKLKYGQAIDVKPTIGFNLESFKSNELDLMVFDVAGGAMSMWPHYLQGAEIIIYVVDASDRGSMTKVTDSFFGVTKEIQENGCFFICLLNKSDLPDAMSNEEFVKESKVYDIFDCDFLLQRTSNVTGEGIDKLLEKIEGYFRSLQLFSTTIEEGD